MARSRALKAIQKALGNSYYEAHEGVNSGGANGIYWIEILNKRPDGLLIVRNITDGAKRKVESLTAEIEPDLVYPLLRGRDVRRWHSSPSVYTLMVKDTKKRCGIDENEMQSNYSKTYEYLKYFHAN